MKKAILIFITFLFFGADLFGQFEGLQEPPSNEKTYDFTIDDFERQPEPPRYMMSKINKLAEKPRGTWTQEDSLYFAYKQVHLEEFEFALSIFTRLKTDTIKETHALKLYHATLLHTRRLEELKSFTYFDQSNSETFKSKQEIHDRLIDVYILQKRKKWSLIDSTVFPFLKDSTLYELKGNNRYNKSRLKDVGQNVDEVLRLFTILHDNTDPILSLAYEEFGDFQFKYFYISNAYLYYTIGLHYNKNNTSTVKKSNRLKSLISEKNYLLPSFRTKFGKIISNRYQFEELKDPNVLPKDTSLLENINLLSQPQDEKKRDYLPWLDSELLIIIGIAILLVLSLLILRTKKN